jgi:hypothetical protein
MNRLAQIAAAALLAACVLPSVAGPFVAPGDVGLRHDILLLADAGIVRGPVLQWPLSWPDIARDVLVAEAPAGRTDLADALTRVQRLARRAATPGFGGLSVEGAGSYEPFWLRDFGTTPREEGALGARASWLGDHLALNLEATVVSDPHDDRAVRADGSYLGLNLWNVAITAGYRDRWWGPGWDGSLILSTNARPIPSLTIERNTSEPFETKWLSWLGYWRASLSIGETEDAGLDVPKVRFLAARVDLKPATWLELGLSRTAQWCGGTRECSFGVFGDLLIGRDNRDPSAPDNDEPGNQMAGYDLRVRSPWNRLPLAFYTQWIGEDEAGGLPSKFLGLAGLEAWSDFGFGSMRWRAEYADTACTFTRQEPDLNCAYRNSLYPQGYTHRGRVIGHSLDNDSRMVSVGAILVRQDGATWSLTARRIELNRDGGRHEISTVPAAFDDVELRFSRVLGIGKVSCGVGHSGDGNAAGDGAGVRGFVSWQQGF